MKICGFRTQAYVGEQFVIRDLFLVIQFMPFLDGCRLTKYFNLLFSVERSLAVDSF